jgi:hypothetical protein
MFGWVAVIALAEPPPVDVAALQRQFLTETVAARRAEAEAHPTDPIAVATYAAIVDGMWGEGDLRADGERALALVGGLPVDAPGVPELQVRLLRRLGREDEALQRVTDLWTVHRVVAGFEAEIGLLRERGRTAEIGPLCAAAWAASRDIEVARACRRKGDDLAWYPPDQPPP